MLNVQQLGHGKEAVAQFFMSYMTINVNFPKNGGGKYNVIKKMIYLRLVKRNYEIIIRIYNYESL